MILGSSCIPVVPPFQGGGSSEAIPGFGLRVVNVSWVGLKVDGTMLSVHFKILSAQDVRDVDSLPTPSHTPLKTLGFSRRVPAL